MKRSLKDSEQNPGKIRTVITGRVNGCKLWRGRVEDQINN